MTIRANYQIGGFEVECDNCNFVIDFDEPETTFEEVKKKIDKDGWRTKLVNNRWQNICPDCI